MFNETQIVLAVVQKQGMLSSDGTYNDDPFLASLKRFSSTDFHVRETAMFEGFFDFVNLQRGVFDQVGFGEFCRLVVMLTSTSYLL